MNAEGPARIAEITARLAAATPGPWGWHGAGCGCQFIQVQDGTEHGGKVITPIADEGQMQDADAELIAAAPADLEFLLSEAARLRGRPYLAVALREALAAGDDPERALQVVEAFMRTMRLRRGPGYEGRMEAARSRQGGEG